MPNSLPKQKKKTRSADETVKSLVMPLKICTLGRIIGGFIPWGFITEGEACHHPIQKDKKSDRV